MMEQKKDIRLLLADGQLDKAAAAAITYAETCRTSEALNALTTLSSQIEENKKNWTMGLIAYEDFSRAYARQSLGISEWLDQLPDTPNATQQTQLMDETVFKRRIFRLLIGSKVAVLAFTFYLWKTGGFINEEATTTFSSLAPAFVAYISLMLSDFIRQSHTDAVPKRRYVSGFLVNIAWWLFPIYALAQIYVVKQKVTGDMSFLQMNAALALTETLIGTYIGRIVEEFFKKEK
jgi:hypothetical protein